MEKISICPKCNAPNPALTIRLTKPELYEYDKPIPDNRHYELICLDCENIIRTIIIDNTIIALKEFRDEMHKLYGVSTRRYV